MLCPCQKREPIFLPLTVLNKILFLLWEHNHGLMACSSTSDHPIHHLVQASGEGLEPQSECHTPTPRWIASYSCMHTLFDIIWNNEEIFPAPMAVGSWNSLEKNGENLEGEVCLVWSLTNKPLFPELTESGIFSPKARVLGVLRRLRQEEIRKLTASLRRLRMIYPQGNCLTGIYFSSHVLCETTLTIWSHQIPLPSSKHFFFWVWSSSSGKKSNLMSGVPLSLGN